MDGGQAARENRRSGATHTADLNERPQRALDDTGRVSVRRELEPERSAEQQIAEAFGDHLVRELRVRNWTIRELAFRSGVDHTTLSRLIHGRRVPTLRTASRLNDALDQSDPVQRFADALEDDPALTGSDRDAIMRYYVRVRSAGREKRA